MLLEIKKSEGCGELLLVSYHTVVFTLNKIMNRITPAHLTLTLNATHNTVKPGQQWQ